MDVAYLALVAAQTVTLPTSLDIVTPLLSTGVVGVVLVMIVFRIRIMPTYVHVEAIKAKKEFHDRERAEWERERKALEAEVQELKDTVKESNDVYTKQVIPLLTRVYDSLDRRKGDRE